MTCLQFEHHFDLGPFQPSYQTVQEELYFFQKRPVDAVLEQWHPTMKEVTFLAQSFQSQAMVDHLDIDPANQQKLQSFGSLPSVLFFADPFCQWKYIDLLHTLHVPYNQH